MSLALLPFIMKAILGDTTPKRKFDPAKDFTGYANGQGFFGKPVTDIPRVREQIRPFADPVIGRTYKPRGAPVRIGSITSKPLSVSSTPSVGSPTTPRRRFM